MIREFFIIHFCISFSRKIHNHEVYTIVQDIYNSTIFSDIVKRNQIRKIDQLERVVRYTFANVGNLFSAKSISDYLKSVNHAIDNETVYSYLEKLEKAYLLHRCSRYDLRGKEILKTQEKFYLADMQDTNGIENFVKNFAKSYYTWNNSKEAIEARTQAISGYLTGNLRVDTDGIGRGVSENSFSLSLLVVHS